MKIAVNTRFLVKDGLEGFGHYTHELLSRIVQSHPDNQYLWYFDNSFEKEYLYSKQVSGEVLFPPAKHPLLFYVWYQMSLRKALQKAKPDVFFSPDSFMPLGLQCPSVITVHDVAHQPYPEAISFAQRKYYQHFMPRFLKEAQKIITVSDFSKRQIIKYYDTDPDKIHVIYNGVSSWYKPVMIEEQGEVRNQYTQDHPYFLFVGAIHPRKNVARLIDAYTKFRELSTTQIKLLIAGRKSWMYRDVEEAIAKSAYKEDIIFTGFVSAEMLAKITGSAFALCYTSLYEGFGLPVVEAMACGVPVIVSKESASSEIADQAGLVVDPLDKDQIAQGMEHLVTDPTLRHEMIEKGLLRSQMFSWDKASEETYEVLKAAGK